MSINAHETAVARLDAAFDAAVDKHGNWRPSTIPPERWAQMCPNGEDCEFGDGEARHWHPALAQPEPGDTETTK